MIEFSEAQALLLSSFSPIESTEQIPIQEALGRVLAKNIHAPIALPPFSNSAMDGYVICEQDVINHVLRFELAGNIPAGNEAQISIEPETCWRIYTGAPIPFNGGAVLMQELSKKHGNSILFERAAVSMENIRFKGEELLENALVFEQGELLKPGHIAVLSELGLAETKVFSQPKIAVMVTGNELVKPGHQLPFGKVFECNSYSLQALLQSNGFETRTIVSAKDDKAELSNQIEQLLASHDVLIISGGMSVGDYDFSIEVLGKLGVQKLFHKVNQKPGKPLFAGKLGNKAIIGLPGNPAAAFICSLVYVLPLLKKLGGQLNPELPIEQGISENSYLKKDGKTHFLKAFVTGQKVKILGHQNSSMLLSLAKANAIAVVPSATVTIEPLQSISFFRF